VEIIKGKFLPKTRGNYSLHFSEIKFPKENWHYLIAGWEISYAWIFSKWLLGQCKVDTKSIFSRE
jgi:hypothetical protein